MGNPLVSHRVQLSCRATFSEEVRKAGGGLWGVVVPERSDGFFPGNFLTPPGSCYR
jgi:hypothetical protein